MGARLKLVPDPIARRVESGEKLRLQHRVGRHRDLDDQNRRLMAALEEEVRSGTTERLGLSYDLVRSMKR